ncbi:MAG: GGDEF domain-containing protein [Gammaproteobacteria bacterium]|nr:GGDEF domain-containing protein [Gammaproteobacteria bacterium]
MASTNIPEAENWKNKYYGLRDSFAKQEAEWVKTEVLLSSAMTKLSLVAEGKNRQIDSHLQALRVVLKEKFNYYRVESVLSELFSLVAEINQKSKNKKAELIELDELIAILEAISLPKAFQKKKDKLTNGLRKNPARAEDFIKDFKQFFNEVSFDKDSAPSAGFISALFSDKRQSERPASLEIIADAISALPWPEAMSNSRQSLVKAFGSCLDADEFEKLLKQFILLAKQWQEKPDSTADTSATAIEKTSSQSLDAELIKQASLSQFVIRLKSFQPAHKKLQSIELSDNSVDNEPEQLAEAISKLLELSSDVPLDYMSRVNDDESDNHPRMREIFIQLLEQLVVPVSLLAKVEVLKNHLETGSDKDWRIGLKKIVHFINEVRFQQYQEEGEYEDFLYQITNRLQEMVRFLEDENIRIEQNDEKGSELNRAVTQEVVVLRQGLETACTLADLRTVVNSRLDAISGFMEEHSLLEKHRSDSAKGNMTYMQNRINLLEKETAELKISLAEKNREAMYDALTGIPNRLFYEKRVSEDIARWKRFDTPLSLAIWDVDKFKSVNDTYGHKAGDKVLKAIAQILNKRIRETDFLARYGGEEFVMLLPGTVEEETLRLANELRLAVAECAFHYNDEAVDITISCGISGFRTGDELAGVFERADKALYQAKASGRNRCVVAACRSN